MNESLRDRIVRHLEPLNDERGYQVLDYIEFLESKYAGPAAASPSVFQRFTEGVEDTLRAGKVSTNAIAETVGFLNKAVGVLSGVAAAGKSVASDIATTGKNVASDIAAVATKAAEAASAAATSAASPPPATATPQSPPTPSQPPPSAPASDSGLPPDGG
jgi:hypothetical protein